MPARGPEVDCGTRAVIAFSRAPLRDISNQVNVPKSTCHDIWRAATDRAKRTKKPVFHEVNQTPYYRDGRPKALSLREEDILILHATLNKEQRAKTWMTIAAEVGLGHVSRSTIERTFHARGYTRCKATHRPYLSQSMKDSRFEWTSERRFWKVGKQTDKDWSNVLFTDETPMPLGVQDQIHAVTRLPSEKWDDDCCVQDFKKPLKLQFFGAIAWNYKGPCYIFDIETEAERATSIAALQEHYKAEYDRQMEAYGVKAMNYYMAKGFNETAKTRGCKKVLTGRLPAKPKAGPQRSKGGGIDWYRFATEVLEPLLLPDYNELRKQRPALMLMLDGAAAHVSANCSPYYDGWDVARLRWPGNSPDPNPIEHIWDLMKKRIKQKHSLIRTVQELKAVWQQEWDQLSLDDINNAIEGQQEAVRRCWKHNGGNTFNG
jgi:transposase